MKKYLFGLYLSLLLVTFSTALSATTLTVAENLIVTEVNNKGVEHGFIGQKSNFTLGPGKHTLIVRFKDVFEDLDFAEEKMVESNPFAVSFLINKQQRLTLKTTKILNLKQAERFAKSPEIMLLDEKTQPLVLNLRSVEEYKIAQQVNLAVAQLDDTKAIHEQPVPLNQQQADNTLIQVDALTMLTYWWQTASDKQKSQFKTLILKNQNQNQN